MIEQLLARGIRVRLDDGALVVSSTNGQVGADDLKTIREHKQAIIDGLPDFYRDEMRRVLAAGKAWMAPDLDDMDKCVLQLLQ